MLRAGETASRTDTGRLRPENEDSYLARAPLFVVADGMGGAQAGEVASRIAVDAFREELPGSGSPEERLVLTAKSANRRIHALSREEAGRQGMGTTLTAALLDEDHLVVAHVGDSRAYLFRAGEMRRLTEDHSLVAELVRRGKLTEAQAEEHPQRSIITRALGPEAEVEVDTWAYPARGGDVILLCSDGLTSMLQEAEIARIVLAHDDLEAAASGLIAAANEAGGRDNITVVLTRLEDYGSARADDHATMVNEPRVGNGETPEGPSKRVAPESAAAGAAVGSDTMILSDLERDEILNRLDGEAGSPRPEPRTGLLRRRRREPVAHSPARRRRRRPQRLARPVAALTSTTVVLALICAGGYLASRQLFFIGTDPRGIVTIYRGLPYDLPLGLSLYETYYSSGVPASLVPADRRKRLFGHSLRSQADAESVVRQLELGRIT